MYYIHFINILWNSNYIFKIYISISILLIFRKYHFLTSYSCIVSHLSILLHRKYTFRNYLLFISIYFSRMYIVFSRRLQYILLYKYIMLVKMYVLWFIATLNYRDIDISSDASLLLYHTHIQLVYSIYIKYDLLII